MEVNPHSFRTLAVSLLLSLLFTNTLAQVEELDPGWKQAQGSGLSFAVPREFRTTSGTMPGHIEGTAFNLKYLSAINNKRELFVSAGKGDIILAPGVNRDDLKDLSERFLENFFGPLDLPFIGRFTDADPDTDEVSEYEALGAKVRETTATFVGNGKDYRIYFAFALKPGGYRTAKMSYIVVGCSEDDIDEYKRVMSTIFASFKAR